MNGSVDVGVLGTGVVGRTIGSALAEHGHRVRLGSRTPDNAAAGDWVRSAGAGASQGTFSDAADFGEVVFNCTPGAVSLSVVTSIPTEALDAKVLIDVSNPLDFSGGFPPTLSVVNTDSLGEQIQRALPQARVVKALNTLNADLMVRPSLLPDRHDLFIAGDDDDAKEQVRSILAEFGWDLRDVHDLGGIAAARGTEMYLPLWLQLMGALGTAAFNVHVVRDAPSG